MVTMGMEMPMERGRFLQPSNKQKDANPTVTVLSPPLSPQTLPGTQMSVLPSSFAFEVA